MDDPIPLDDVAGPECDCEFTPEAEGEEAQHYLRRCGSCEIMCWSLHCPHDGVQSRCSCGERLPSLRNSP